MVAVKQAVERDQPTAIPETLQRLQAAVGVGRIGGPYNDRPLRAGYSSRRRPQFMWYAIQDEARQALALLWPYLGRLKREALAEPRKPRP
jgi:hypothetical protein